MVALASWIQPENPASAAKDRVGDFFGANPESVGESALQVVEGDWEKSFRRYDSRRGNPSAQKENTEDVDKDLLKKLCDSQAGRDLVGRINNETINIFSSETAFPSTRHLGFFDSTTYRNTGSVNIYVNRAVDTVGEFRAVGYSGPGREGQALIIRHEIGEYDARRNMPGEPSWVRDAHARWDADQFARSAGFQPWFPGSDLQDLLGANAPSPSDPDGYSSRKVGRSDYEQMIADRIRITGFDCSRLDD